MLQETIRLFVSSTFSDFQAGRAALHNDVFQMITHHPCQVGASYSSDIQELLLKVCRTGLRLLMESKRLEETRKWAAYCLPAYEKVFGVDGERSIALRGIAESENKEK
ncbi:MAG: hypothetical protein RSD05_09790 [Comamonas sp.]